MSVCARRSGVPAQPRVRSSAPASAGHPRKVHALRERLADRIDLGRGIAARQLEVERLLQAHRGLRRGPRRDDRAGLPAPGAPRGVPLGARGGRCRARYGRSDRARLRYSGRGRAGAGDRGEAPAPPRGQERAPSPAARRRGGSRRSGAGRRGRASRTWRCSRWSRARPTGDPRRCGRARTYPPARAGARRSGAAGPAPRGLAGSSPRSSRHCRAWPLPPAARWGGSSRDGVRSRARRDRASAARAPRRWGARPCRCPR